MDRKEKKNRTLVIGLGNPGNEYAETRHNFGSRAVELFAQKLGVKLKTSRKLNALIATSKLDGADLVLAVPQSYMNDSGLPAASLLQYYKLKPERLIVIHDEIDLPFGTLRIGQFTSSGGHNGVASIIEHLKTSNFIRVRLGIGPQTGVAEQYVLEPWSKDQRGQLASILDRATEALQSIILDGAEKTANTFN